MTMIFDKCVPDPHLTTALPPASRSVSFCGTASRKHAAAVGAMHDTGARRKAVSSTRRPIGLAAFAVFVLAAGAAAAENDGSATGMILDGRSGTPVRGASIALEGGTASTVTSVDGVFQLDLPAGTHAVVVSAEGYESQRILDVVVEAGGLAQFSAVLMPAGAGGRKEASLSETITVEAAAIDASASALLAERKAAAEILDNIGSEEISKNSGSDAADALRRVTGISLQDSKFAYVRGLGDRYGNTTLDGSRIPSTEFERKVVPLDLFDADLLDNVTVRKSYSPDQPGDFAAGAIELVTRNFPARQVLSVGLSGGHNSETTGSPMLQDPIGLSSSGAGGQPLPSDFPDRAVVRQSRFLGIGFSSADLERMGERIAGRWSPTDRGDAPFGRGGKIAYGNTFGGFGVMLAGNWDNGHETRHEERTFYAVGANNAITPLHDYDFDYGVEQVKQSWMGNFAIRTGDSGQIEIRSLQTSLSMSEARFQEGFFSDINNDIEDYRLQYEDQEVFNLQIGGDHYLSGVGSNGSTLTWRGSSSTAETHEDLRQTIHELFDDGFRLTNNGQSGFMYFNDLEDEIDDYRGDWETFFANGDRFGSFKVGVRRWTNERTFGGRRLRMFPRHTEDIDLGGTPEQIYVPENIDFFGFQLTEVTNATDSYTADWVVDAAYAQVDHGFDRWRFVGGLRFEDSDQNVRTIDRTALGGAETVTNKSDSDVTGSLSVIRSLSAAQNLRFSLSRTVNRPEFREVAPFRFKHIVGGFVVVGNPHVGRALIDSFDARWEWFPSAGDVVAASVFYKDFTDPIESVVISAVEPTETFRNAEGARNLGVELEFRRNLGFRGGRGEDWTAILNYTFIDSEIRIDARTTVLTNPVRPLAGQPDNLVNLGLEWAPDEYDTTLRVLYSLVDDRIHLGGVEGLPDVTESGRGTVDVVWRQGLVAGLDLKLAATNLLGEEREWTQGGEIFRLYDPGRSISLGLGYSF